MRGAMFMMVLKKLKIGTIVNIVNINKTIFDGTVTAIIGANFVVRMSLAQQAFISSKKGTKLDYLVGFETEAFRCSSFVMDVKTNNDYETIVLTMPEVTMVVERRQFVRLRAIMPVSYYLMHKTEFYRELKDVPAAYWKKTKSSFTIDIGGGGVSLITYENSDITQSALLRFSLGEDIKVLCSVVRSIANVKDDTYATAFKFEDISEENRVAIIRYVNEKVEANNQ
jgi:c-di-GMP-binding flagellar brake protein YcgR